MKVYGNIRELVAAFFRRNGFEIGITPHANTYLANTTFTLPPKTSGAGILVSEDGVQDLSGKTLQSPTLVTPALGTPASGNLSNTTAFPTANLSGLGANMATFLATPTSANLAATLTDETGTGPNVFGTSPTITGPLFTSDTVFSNIATPANPSAGTIKIYSKAGVPTYLSSAGVERVIANTTDSLSNPMTAVGDLIYGGTSGVATRLAPNITTTRNFLRETGTGAAGLAPVWDTILGADVPAATAALQGTVSITSQTFTGPKTIDGQDGNPASFAGSLNLNASGAANQISLRFGTYTTGDYSWISSLQTTTGNAKPLRFYSGTTQVADYTTAGAFTLGPSTGSAPHTIQSGSLTPLTIVRTGTGSGRILFMQGATTQFQLGYEAVAGDTMNGTSLNDIALRCAPAAGGISLGGGAGNNMYFRVGPTGALTAPSIHNLGSGDITSGRYTPTGTPGTNVNGALTYFSCHYMRVGNTVTVSGRVDLATTAGASTPTDFTISLPIASNFTTSLDLQGSGAREAASGTQYQPVTMTADTVNDRAQFSFNSNINASNPVRFTFQYEVK